MQFQSIISWNYLKALMLLVLSLLAAGMVVNDLR